MTQILDHGYLKYIEHYGSDERIIEAARMSVNKGFLGWEPGVCPTCEAVVTDERFIQDNNGVGNPALYGKTMVRQSDGYYRICTDCNGTGKIPGDLGLLRRLWIKKHATPFEMAGLIVEAQAPIMVFREWHRHRTQSYNEMSARYTPLPDLNYVPSVERLLMNQGTKNRQAGTIADAEVLDEAGARRYQEDLRQMWERQQALYEVSLKAGVPKELARVHLGVGRYSRMRASANLRNWLGFLALRMAEDAQWEIRQYAFAVAELIALHFPRTMSLFMEGK